jgi:hypothetical protein
MPVGESMNDPRSNLSDCRIRSVAVAVTLSAALGALVVGAGCMTRSGTPVWGADSTLVYPSKMATDVNATIRFQLKESAARDAVRKADKDRRREISKLRRQRDNILALEEERDRKAKADAKRKASAEKKAKGKKKKKNAVDPVPNAVESMALRPNPAMRDSLASLEARLAVLAAEDSVSALIPWKLKREDGSAGEEHSFEIEEGARVQATVRFENVYARGKRPLMIHFVWTNPAQKRVFKRMVEYTPNDSTQSLTSSLSITPTKRSAGHYSLQVFLFREQIAEKSFELTGKGMEENEKGDDAM